jgi:hypothetical protein
MSNATAIVVRLTTDAYLSIVRTMSTARWPRLLAEACDHRGHQRRAEEVE